MVVLGVALINDSERGLFFKPYGGMTLEGLEGYVGEFLLLHPGQDCSYVVAPNACFHYQPIKSMYLLTVTDSHSNFNADMGTIKRLHRRVSEILSILVERGISSSISEMAIALDEVINPTESCSSVPPGVTAEPAHVEFDRNRKEEFKAVTSLPSAPVAFFVTEKIEVTRHTSVNSTDFNMHGMLFIRFLGNLGAVEKIEMKAETNLGICYEPHPQINKEMVFKEGILLLGNLYWSIKLEPDSDIGIMRWNLASGDPSTLPLMVDLVTISNGLRITYQVSPTYSIQDFSITVPVLTMSQDVENGLRCAPGVCSCDSEVPAVRWTIPDIFELDPRTGFLDITNLAPDTCPQVSVAFKSECTMSKLKVDKITPMRPGDPRVFSQNSKLATENYTVLL